MRLLIIFTVFFSFFSMATGITLHIKAEHPDETYAYAEDLTLTPSEKYPGVGDVNTVLQSSNTSCTGYYIMDWANSSIRIIYDGLKGRGTHGGCHNESLTLKMGLDQFLGVSGGKSAQISFSSQRFYNKALLATVTKVNP